VLAQDAAIRGGKITDDGLDYSFAYQARYGGSSAWLTNLVSSSSSRVLTQISGHLSSTIVVAAVIAVAFQAASVGSLPEPLGAAVRACALPSLPHEAVGSIIALLLAFRTGQAYDRFWEGRQLWDGARARQGAHSRRGAAQQLHGRQHDASCLCRDARNLDALRAASRPWRPTRLHRCLAAARAAS